jgi:hypothetical protein
MRGYHPAPHRKLPSDVLPVPYWSPNIFNSSPNRSRFLYILFCPAINTCYDRYINYNIVINYWKMLLRLSDILVVFEKRHIDIGHQCVRCYLKIFLIGVATKIHEKIKRGCFRSQTKLNFLTSLLRYIFSAPHYVHVQSHRNPVVSSQRKSSVTAQYASC